MANKVEGFSGFVCPHNCSDCSIMKARQRLEGLAALNEQEDPARLPDNLQLDGRSFGDMNNIDSQLAYGAKTFGLVSNFTEENIEGEPHNVYNINNVTCSTEVPEGGKLGNTCFESVPDVKVIVRKTWKMPSFPQE